VLTGKGVKKTKKGGGKMVGKMEAAAPKRSNKTVPRRSATKTVLFVENGFSGASLATLFSSKAFSVQGIFLVKAS
jgi:hypothetical protein